jgi:hypothetical protein
MSLGALYTSSSGTRGAVVGNTSKTAVLTSGVESIDGSGGTRHTKGSQTSPWGNIIHFALNFGIYCIHMGHLEFSDP